MLLIHFHPGCTNTPSEEGTVATRLWLATCNVSSSRRHGCVFKFVSVFVSEFVSVKSHFYSSVHVLASK